MSPDSDHPARVAALSSRLHDLGLAPDEFELESLASIEGMFRAALALLEPVAASDDAAMTHDA
jgi:hypothetical protein